MEPLRGTLPRETDPAVLVCRAQAGDTAAEEALVLLYQGRLTLFMRRRVGDPEAARELANDVLMAMVRAVRERRLQDVDKLSSFVRGIARNLANSHLRAKVGRPVLEPLTAEHAVTDPIEGLEREERILHARAAVDQLGFTEREILRLTLEEGLKPGQIARSLGLSPEVVRSRKSRALRKLQLS
jgi:RNA polymerase sigma factor (sigma-70 family)